MSNPDGTVRIRRALVSVYDKTGLDELATALHAAGVQIVSTGSTAARIAAAGVPVVEVSELTGFPECLDGRVKTLHPKVHAGILADLRLDDHHSQLEALGIEPFGLVVVNLYPFTATVASGASPDECIEQIDIGGPSMVRGAAKNHASVAVVTSPAAYGEVIAAVQGEGFTLAQRARLAAEAFVHTATYDIAVASWMGNVVAPTDEGSGFPAWVGAAWERAAVLRYGENPHQGAALYTSAHFPGGLASAEQLHGKEMSYNNYVDADAAYRAAYDFAEPAVAIIKHANPCGIAIGDDIAQAHARAHETDPVSAFGGVIAANRTGDRGDGRAGRRGVHRGDRRPRLRRRRPRAAHGEEEPADPRGAPGPGRRRRRDPPDQRRAAHADPRPHRRPRRRPHHLDARVRRARGRRDPGRPRVRLAGLPVGEVQRDPAGQRRCGGRHRHGPGQPRGLRAARGGAGGRGAGAGCGRRLRRVLPVPRRARGASRGRACAPWCSPAAPCATPR